MSRITPPRVLRHVLPWFVLRWFDRRAGTCWSGVVMWKLGHDGWSWWPGRTCWDGPQGGYDYCNKYSTREGMRDGKREVGTK